MHPTTSRAHRFDDQVVIPALGQQLTLLGFEPEPTVLAEGTYFDAPTVDLDSYDHVVVCVSGKDSIACLLALIEQGVDLRRVELWHHRVDGAEGSTLMDWAFNDSFIEKFAEAFNLPVYFSWLQGGIEGEMLKMDAYSKPHMVETPGGIICLDRDTSRTSPARIHPMPRQALLLALLAILTSGCTSAPIQNQAVPAGVRSAAMIAPGCIQLADGWHCQELVPASKAESMDRQRVPGILL